MMDKLTATGLIFFLLIAVAYIIIFSIQYKNVTADSSRVTVLLTRTALFLPLYALFMMISLAQPKALAGMTVLIAIVEGYSFYNFLAVIVENLGGPAKVVEAIQGRPLFCCTSRCPTEPDKFYNKVLGALFWFFVFLRPIIVFLAALAYYSNTPAGKLFYGLLNLVALAMLIYSLVHFVLLYEAVYEKSKNIKGILKVMLLKFSVGLIVLQGLIEEFMIAAGSQPYNDDSDWDKDEKTQRGYAILVLLEFTILILPYLIAYTPSITPAAVRDPAALPAAVPNCMSFLCSVLSFHDIFGSMGHRGEMQQNLTANNKL